VEVFCYRVGVFMENGQHRLTADALEAISERGIERGCGILAGVRQYYGEV
jgi:hypothetical protein